MTRPVTADRQPKRSTGGETVRMAVITFDNGTAHCSCGWAGEPHRREKIVQDKAQRHLDKHHGGQGLWL